MWTNSSQASISIHALREEGDYNPFVHTCFFGYFYPRPPRGGRLVEFCQLHQPVVFLSTPSARRATRNSYMFTRFLRDFYPRPPRGGRQDSETNGFRIIKFLSTPSARRATTRPPRPRRWHSISIHALREEGDAAGDGTSRRMGNFYPRPPRGGRPADGYLFSDQYGFLSTPSARRATDCFAVYVSLCRISIHALREEGDNYAPLLCLLVPYFYPRPPRGGRQQKQRQNLYFQTNYTTFCTNLEEL